MANKQYLSVFNDVKGYHQVDIEEEVCHKTTFICHRGLFQYKRLLFCLKNAPGQYERLVIGFWDPSLDSCTMLHRRCNCVLG